MRRRIVGALMAVLLAAGVSVAFTGAEASAGCASVDTTQC